VRVYHAGSSECFGDTGGDPATELTPFRPRSPYAVAKASAFWLVDNYREAYDLFVCTGILFNHESPLRPDRFVTQKIIKAVTHIAAGSREQLLLGRMDIARDWGWAPDYVQAMWAMLQQSQPQDYVIATGHTNTLESCVAQAFAHCQLDWRAHVRQSAEFVRPTDILVSRADASKAKRVLGWVAEHQIADVVRLMLQEAQLTTSSGTRDAAGLLP
jgi:GDPmannose 4,6-dehydratase